MRRASLAIVVAAALSACGNGMTSEEKAAHDERDIAMVEKANRGQPIPVSPLPILFPDIEKYDLYGTTCAFVAQGGGVGAIAIARDRDAYVKYEDRMVRFAADKGSAPLPYGTHGRYDGKEHSLQLAIDQATGRQNGAEAMTYKGRLTLRDPLGNVVYDQPGEVQCGS